MHIIYSDYPKYNAKDARVDQTDKIDVNYSIVNLANAGINNYTHLNPRGNPRVLRNKIIKDIAYSSFANIEYNRLLFSYGRAIDQKWQLYLEAEYLNFNPLLELDPFGEEVHKFWDIKKDFRDKILPHQDKNYILIDQQSDEVVFELDMNKANNTLSGFNFQLKHNFFDYANWQLAGIAGTNLLGSYLNRVSKCTGGCPFDHKENLLAGFIFDVEITQFLATNMALIRIYKRRKYLSKLKQNLNQFQLNLAWQLEQLATTLKDIVFKAETNIISDVVRNDESYSFQVLFSLEKKLANSKLGISFAEDDGSALPSNIDFAIGIYYTYNYM